MTKIRITQRLARGGLIEGRGFVSNMHWLVRKKRADWSGKPDRVTNGNPQTFLKGRQYLLRRTKTRDVPVNVDWTSVLFVGRSGRLRVWLNEDYADALGLTDTAYGHSESDPVTDRPGAKWTVMLMPMR